MAVLSEGKNTVASYGGSTMGQNQSLDVKATSTWTIPNGLHVSRVYCEFEYAISSGQAIKYYFNGQTAETGTSLPVNGRQNPEVASVDIDSSIWNSEAQNGQLYNSLKISFKAQNFKSQLGNPILRNVYIYVVADWNAQKSTIVTDPATMNIGDVVSFSLQNPLKNVQHSITWAITGGPTYTNTSSGASGKEKRHRKQG